MKNIYILFIAAALISCEQKYSIEDQQKDQLFLYTKYNEVLSYISLEETAEDSKCSTMGIGKDPCGNFKGYVSFPETTDIEELKGIIEDYNSLEQKYNKRYSIESPCKKINPPKKAIVFGGVCKAVFN
jgi:hypothetical protein